MERQPVIKPVYQNVQDVGKNIKQSKKRYTWMLQIDGKMYNFVLDASVLSGKIKLSCNNKIVAMSESQTIQDFQHTMALNNNQITILSANNEFELRINNKAFSHMLNQQRTNMEFVKNKQACQDFVLDQKISNQKTTGTGQKKTIKLKIGGLKINSNRSCNKSIESEDWNKMMSGQQNQFPNYFEAHSIESSNTNSSDPIDPSKISMKKRPVCQQSSKLDNKYSSEQQAHVIQITPQQFSTMQQLFRTQIPAFSKQPETSIQKKSQQNNLNGINLYDFNTMQLMFQTGNGVEMKNKEEGMQREKENEPVELNINLQDFNTMQMMFRTMNFGVDSQLPQTKTLNTNPLNLLESTSQQSSNPLQKQEIQKSALNALDSINITDFNTMQKMFSTNIQNPLAFNLDFDHQTTQLTQPPLTNNNEKIQSSPNPPSTTLQFNPLDFSTMANLFNTINYAQSQPGQIKKAQQLQTNFETYKPNPLSQLQPSSSNNNNLTNINMNDFNTMQLMFKTNSNLGDLTNSNLFGTSLFNTQIPQKNKSSSMSTQLKQNESPIGSLI